MVAKPLFFLQINWSEQILYRLFCCYKVTAAASVNNSGLSFQLCHTSTPSNQRLGFCPVRALDFFLSVGPRWSPVTFLDHKNPIAYKMNIFPLFNSYDPALSFVYSYGCFHFHFALFVLMYGY